MMQLTGVDQVESLLAHVLESRNNFFRERRHAVRISFVTGDVEIKMLLREAIRHTGKTREKGLNLIDASELHHLQPAQSAAGSRSAAAD